MGIVLQETYLFRDRVATNIAYTRPVRLPDDRFTAPGMTGSSMFLVTDPRGSRVPTFFSRRLYRYLVGILRGHCRYRRAGAICASRG